jgi:hypothetical protein
MKDNKSPMPPFTIIVRSEQDEQSWFELALEELEKQSTKE